MIEKEIIEVYETLSSSEANTYINTLHWVLLETGTKYNPDTKELTIYYALGRPEGVSNERW